MKLWSPENPFLYDLTVSLYQDGEIVDEVTSYFGMREIRLGTASDGFVRLFLNDEPLFHFGLLDQGFWPDGVYTAPTDGALKYDIQVTKDLGFNMIRKHVKVEPNRWYYWADKIGILVWQDMPNGVPSGWQDRGAGDMNDIHSYPGPDMPETEEDRAAILGEFGGQALVVKDHLWIQDFSRAPNHYKTSTSKEKLHSRYDELVKGLFPLKRKGLAGAVYTQTTDVESEVNGVMTYDREVIKFDVDHLKELHQNLINLETK